MLKACTPVAVLIFSYFAGLETTTAMELNIVSLISLGVAMTSIGESYFSLIGFCFQLLGILAESSRLVLTNIFLKELKLDPLSNLYYIAPVCACFTGLAMMCFEAKDLPYERMFGVDFIAVMLANGLVAFTLNIAVVMLIGNTSALTLTLAGVVKDVMLVVMSMVIFNSPVTMLQYLGYAVALLALNLHKEYKKMSAAALPASPPSEDRARLMSTTYPTKA